MILEIIIFACWGSFLNVVAYRITYDKPFFTKRSYCPHCSTMIAWYDNLPIVSWLLLRGTCRTCHGSISILYPFIELLSAIVFTALYIHTSGAWLAFAFYGIFFSALLVAVRTDLEELIIPQLVSLWLIPLGILGAWLQISDVSFTESVLGAVLGYGVLWSVGVVYTFFTKREGIGVGDMELLGMIGSFIGLLGAWFSLLIGSITGLFIGSAYLLVMGKTKDTKIPFGPFLILGATLYFFYKTFLLAAIS